MPNAIYNHLDILEITSTIIDDLKSGALASPRKRFRFCMHKSNTDPTHEMLIVFYRASFMPPHRHPHWKSESYHVIKGSMKVFFFNNEGKVIKDIDMGEYGSEKPFLYRLSSNEWHMPVPTSEWLIYHETYTGPFIKEKDVEFPDWAPTEDDKEEIANFMKKLRI